MKNLGDCSFVENQVSSIKYRIYLVLSTLEGALVSN